MDTNDRLLIEEEEWFYESGDLSLVIKKLQDKLESGWQTAYGEYQLFRSREENDQEYKIRLEREESRKQDRLRQYKELRKEFGDLV